MQELYVIILNLRKRILVSRNLIREYQNNILESMNSKIKYIY